MQKPSTVRDGVAGAPPSAGAFGSSRNVKDRLVREAVRFGLMFVYLWVMFSLFVLYERIIRGQMGLGFQAQGFALINALVLAKVMLVAEDLNLDRGMHGRPLVYSVVGEAALFAIVFIAFHVFEWLALGLLHNSTLAGSVPAIGGGGFAALVTAAEFMFVVLIPYFAFREIGRALGPRELRRLLFSRAAIARARAAPPR
jgi:hypothetical protein